MIRRVGRRLALLNALVVALVVTGTVVAVFIIATQALVGELDGELGERADSVAALWAPALKRRSTPPGDAVSDTTNRDGDAPAIELLEGGDTLVYVADATGRLVSTPVAGAPTRLPEPAGLATALAGEENLQQVEFSEGISPRILSRPLLIDGQIIGATQVVRGTGERDNQLRLVAIASLVAGTAGALVAVGAGLFLARRAMGPIDLAFDRQRTFVADASHELRSPLTVIRANVELAQRLLDAQSEVVVELDAVLSEIDGMAAMVDDLLILARAEDRQTAATPELVALATLVQGAVVPLLPMAAAEGVALVPPGDGGPIVNVYPAAIGRVVRNLVDNALRATPTGGQVAVSIVTESATARVVVSDTGRGIAPAERERIFDRFYRSDAGRARATGGTGLGLAISRALVEAHGGTIGVDSRVGGGAVVWFSLPLADGGGNREDRQSSMVRDLPTAAPPLGRSSQTEATKSGDPG